EFAPARRCSLASWRCLPDWSIASIPTRSARERTALFPRNRSHNRNRPRTRPRPRSLTVASQKRFAVGKGRSDEAAAIRAQKENRVRGRVRVRGRLWERLDVAWERLEWENHRLTHVVNKCCSILVEPLFDHEKLDVYSLELQFVAWIADFFEDVSRCSAQRRRELFEQLDRASLSALLNTAEGNAIRPGRQRAKFFDDARGSAIECA